MRRRTWWLGVLLLLLPRLAAAQRADNPHGTSVQGMTCNACHRADGWTPAVIAKNFRHAPQAFPLEGAHAKTSCTSCHASVDFSRAMTSCVSCHQDVHKGELGTQCAHCHAARTFTDRAAMARTHQTGRFPLQGAHAAVACESCHAPTSAGQMQFVNRPASCIGCHAEAYRGTRSPDHVAASFSQNCTSCHTLIAWTSATFDHSTTKFPLEGAHRTASCERCHGDQVFHGKTTTCIGCHEADFARPVSPKHAAAQFSTECLTCHTMLDWKGVTFDHSASRFPLRDRHVTATCQGCHADDVYKGRATACASCHAPAYNATHAPPHAVAGFPTVCESCHKNAAAWTGAPFDHATTRFPLTGGHRAASCNDCHADKVYRGKPTACRSCHQADFTRTTNPPHATVGFPGACETCHTTGRWTGAVFDHSSITTYPLTGAHVAASGNGCHGTGMYKGTPTTCVACHQTTYTATTNPSHASAGFTTACQRCHNTASWVGGTFDHNATKFPLVGAHTTTSCVDCHTDGVYAGKPTTCVSCHLANYNSATNPPHKSEGLPTTCETCHTTTQWLGATFDHDGPDFPIYSGAHRGKWNTCADCHINTSNYRQFECILCHEHSDKSKVDGQHKGRSGYSYTSAACYSCHPRGTH